MTTAVRNRQAAPQTRMKIRRRTNTSSIYKKRDSGRVPYAPMLESSHLLKTTPSAWNTTPKSDILELRSPRYRKRVETLMGYASEEGITVNNPSVKDFEQFVDVVISTSKAMLVVMDNGNVRAIWKNSHSRLGVEFRGGGRVHYVVSMQMPLEGKLYEDSGECSFDEIRASVDRWGLWTMVAS